MIDLSKENLFSDLYKSFSEILLVRNLIFGVHDELLHNLSWSLILKDAFRMKLIVLHLDIV